MPNLLRLFQFSADDQKSISSTIGTMHSVAEFLTDCSKAVERKDFLDYLAGISPWWLTAMGETVSETAPVIKVVTAIVKRLGEIRDPDRLGYVACTAAFKRSVERALCFQGPPGRDPVNRNWSAAESAKPDDEISFATFSIDSPWQHQFLVESMRMLRDAMHAMGYSDDEVRRIVGDVQMRFVGNLKALLTHPNTREKFAAFRESCQLGNSEERVRAAWADHAEYLRYQYEDKPVFGEERFSLAEIYEDTECGVVTFGDLRAEARKHTGATSVGQTSTDPFSENCGGRHELIAATMKLIRDPKFRDVIIVQGPAGAGKSAYSLRLAIELLHHGYRPIRVRVRDIPLTYTNIFEALPHAVRFWDEEQFPDRTIDVKPDELFLSDGGLFDQEGHDDARNICPWVVILDGWDEVSVAAEKGYTIRIQEMLAQLRERFLQRGNRPLVRVVLTGRPSEAVTSSSLITNATVLLTVRSLAPDRLREYVYRLAPRLVEPGDAKLAAKARFKKVLDSYARGWKHQREGAGTLEVLSLPLLAHLAVRLMVRWPDDDLERLLMDPTTLYRLLTDLTCARGGRFGPDTYQPSLDGGRIRRLLQSTAAAMTTFGRDNIPYDELDNRLSSLCTELAKEVNAITRDHPATSLMISFFFKGGRTELGAEFLHKSFREYLYAESIVEAIKDFARGCEKLPSERDERFYFRDFDPTDPRFALSRSLAQLLGPNWITPEVATFLSGLLSWELNRSRTGGSTSKLLGEPTGTISEAKWTFARDALADLWDWWGEGVHLRPRPEFRGKIIDRWESAYVDELVAWARPIPDSREPRQNSARYTSIDSHLGDGLFRLCVLVHHFCISSDLRGAPSGAVADDAGKLRRYQSVRQALSGERTVRYRPTGNNPRYFANYAARINAAGWYPTRLFPHWVPCMSVDFSDTILDFLPFGGHTAQFGSLLEGCTFDRSEVYGCCFFGVDHGLFEYCKELSRTLIVSVRHDVSIPTSALNCQVTEPDGAWRPDDASRTMRIHERGNMIIERKHAD